MAETVSLSGTRLAATILVATVTASLAGAASLWVQTNFVCNDPVLRQQIVTIQVYGVLIGSLIISFRP